MGDNAQVKPKSLPCETVRFWLCRMILVSHENSLRPVACASPVTPRPHAEAAQGRCSKFGGLASFSAAGERARSAHVPSMMLTN